MRADLGDSTLHGYLLVPNTVGTRQHLVHIIRIRKCDKSKPPVGLLGRGRNLGDVRVLHVKNEIRISSLQLINNAQLPTPYPHSDSYQAKSYRAVLLQKFSQTPHTLSNLPLHTQLRYTKP